MQPALFFEPMPVPRLPGPAVGPKGPKIGKKKRPDSSFILPKVCPISRLYLEGFLPVVLKSRATGSRPPGSPPPPLLEDFRGV